ncbi:MAG: hypothetical protein ABW252_11100 [Polyangiales bacterium]
MNEHREGEFELIALENLEDLELMLEEGSLRVLSDTHIVQLGDAWRCGLEPTDRLMEHLGALRLESLETATRELVRKAEAARSALEEPHLTAQAVLVRDALESALHALAAIAMGQGALPRDVPGRLEVERALLALEEQLHAKISRKQCQSLLGPRAGMREPDDWLARLWPTPLVAVGAFARLVATRGEGPLETLSIQVAAEPAQVRVEGEHRLLERDELDVSYSLETERLLIDLKVDRELGRMPTLVVENDTEQVLTFAPTAYSEDSFEVTLPASTLLNHVVLQVPLADKTIEIPLEECLHD